jgi:hypothetical protein
MTQARRAIARRRRRATGRKFVAAALTLFVVASLIGLGIRHQLGLGNLPISRLPSVLSSTTAIAPTPSDQAQTDSASSALKACKAKVEAADKVLAVAKDGMRHWSEHVQAQTDANARKITPAEMEGIFEKTKKAGDDDEKRYGDAVKAHQKADGSCKEVPGAPAEVAVQLTRCAKRAGAQESVLNAAHDGMADWTKHLGDMRRSRKGKIHNPQKKWLQTWRAAPPHIKAYNRAVDRFSAPRC